MIFLSTIEQEGRITTLNLKPKQRNIFLLFDMQMQ